MFDDEFMYRHEKPTTGQVFVLAGLSLSLCHFSNDRQVQHDNTKQCQLGFCPQLQEISFIARLFVFQ